MHSSAKAQCPICAEPVDSKDDLVTTECGHTFHRTCAQRRLDTRQKTDCRVCQKDSALGEALRRDEITIDASCSICKNPLRGENDLVTTECGHTFHRTCAQHRLDTRQKTDCRVCRKDSALGEALRRDKTTAKTTRTRERSPNQIELDKNVEKGGYTTTIISTGASNAIDKKANCWECQKCSIENEESSNRCESCGEPRYRFPISDAPTEGVAVAVEEKHSQPVSPTKDQRDDPYTSSKPIDRVYPVLESSPPTTPHSTSDKLSDFSYEKTSRGSEQEQRPVDTPDTKNRTDTQVSRSPPKSRIETTISTPRSRSPSPLEREGVVYVSDLPSDIEDDLQLAQTIRNRIFTIFHVEPIDMKCYSKFGIGCFRVKSNEIKEHLVNVVGKMVWDTKEGSVVITFMDTPEFVSYIVLDKTNEKKDMDLPKSNEVVRRWIDVYSGEMPIACDQVNIQFPNIYRIVSKSLDELLRVALNPEFVVNNRRARVYLCADCSYFEDLPISTTEHQLQELIGNAIGLKKISLLSLYIESNKQTNNACIVAAGTARRWATKNSIYIGDESILKKRSLSCRLVIRPVRKKEDVNAIVRHRIFDGKAKMTKHCGENLILKIMDKKIFDECLKYKDLCIDERTTFSMKIYTGTSDLDVGEIDVDTWYEGEMLQCESNIMPFFREPEHKIFRLKWNSQIWLEQFQRITSQKQGATNNDDSQYQGHVWANKMRHLLRVTVMLSTIAAIRKKSYMIGDREIKLNLNEKLMTIVYNHKSKLQYGGTMPIKRTPYTKTEVKVVNEDCLVVYENLVKQGKKPLLLNMASATSAGGGYRKGDGAQEENLFRRSDYLRSLDTGLDEFVEDPSERSHCSSTGDLDSTFDSRRMYPMDEYGAIYTSGLTVFRQTETNGYEYMEKPLTNVCSLAMAGYRFPRLDGKMLAPRYAVGMRKKIENIFSIAYHHKHDCLVLSALGCGAFRNPPDHVAKLFRSVIEQYAGFFQLIVFAIIDDHNTGQSSNPHGNFLPFQRELDGQIVRPIEPMNQPNTMFGPYRLSSDGSTVNDVCICDSIPCHFGAKCRDLYDRKHNHQYSHPPLCIEVCLTGTCTQMNDIVHMTSFIHRNPCKYGAQCRDIDNKKHAEEYEHPSYCPGGGACQDTSDNHEKEYRHLPLCKNGHKCTDFRKRVKAHCDVYRHYIPRCQYGSCCVHFHDRQHIDDYEHPFSLPCPWTPYHCALHDEFTQASDKQKLPRNVQQHCFEFSHVCRFGRNCSDQSSVHWKQSIHVPRCLCPLGQSCMKLSQDDHLNSFTHANIQDIRYLCKFASKCQQRHNPEHAARYYHAITFEDGNVIRYYDLNKNMNFVENQRENIKRVMRYVQQENWAPFSSGSVPQEILDWLRTVQPVHRCHPDVVESILLHEHVMSREYMEHLKKPKFVANCILRHSRIQRIDALKMKTCAEHAKNYTTALVIDEYVNRGFLQVDSATSNDQLSSSDSATRSDSIRREEGILLNHISQDDIKVIRQTTIEIAQTSMKLHANPASLGHLLNREFGTNKHVFSILGPHSGHHYGDVFIVFKREILHHPDANFSMQAAASYANGDCYKYRPWLGTDSNSEDERIKLFRESKLHASITDFEYAAAIELIALTSYASRQRTMNVNLDMILRRCFKIDSHETIEAHLPQLIPLNYIDHIYMTQNIYDSFNANTRHAIQTVFSNRFTIPSVKSIEEYYHFVMKTLIDRDIQSMPRSIRGFAMTIPSTHFTDNLVLPLTISQAYTQYNLRHRKTSADITIYIYWQAMNGDMMLRLSNEHIDTNKPQSKLHCLNCYIAEKPIPNNTQYHEYASYLAIGHETSINQGQYAAKSTSFYVGCNTDDFITFCLEMQCSTGMVTLSHAGSNSIYNHETISCTFTQLELDLKKLEFIYVSGGTHTVPIRNLIVTFEKQSNLHPTIDTNFEKVSSEKTPTNNDRGNRRASSFTAGDDQPERSSSLIGKVKEKAVQIMDQAAEFVFGSNSSSLTPCIHSINCFVQFSDSGKDHNSKYSHPCRYAELCRNPEPHLTHEPRRVTACRFNEKCTSLCDPFHRAQYRHSGWPYFLIPCRHQSNCRDRSEKHRIKYSHGERVLEANGALVSKDSPKASSRDDDHIQRVSCRWGLTCRDIADPKHSKKYSLSAPPNQQQENNRTLYRSNSEYSDYSHDNRKKYPS